MNVFISHAWNDKTSADMLVSEIKPLCDHVWLNGHQLAIHKIDLVLLLWSKHAANSAKVTQEIATSLQTRKTIIPCHSDDTPLPIALQHSSYSDFQSDRMIETIRQWQTKLDQISIPLPPVQPPQQPENNMQFQPTPDIFQQTLSQVAQEKNEIRQGLQPFTDSMLLPRLTELVHYYVVTGVDLLGLLHDITQTAESASALRIVQSLYHYLQNGNDLLAESEYGAWGLIDEAWLIHNTAYRLIEAGLVAIELFPFNWDNITAADKVVIRMLPSAVARQLEARLLQFMNLIAMEVTDYQPQFSYQQDNYHPYMGAGQALHSMHE